MSIEEIAAKGILGLKAPPPKIQVDNAAVPTGEEEENADYATDVVSLTVEADPIAAVAAEDNEKDVPISAAVAADDVDADQASSDESEEHGDTAQPKRQEIEPIQKEQQQEEVQPMETETEQQFEQPIIILDAPPPSANADNVDDIVDDDQDAPVAYEEVSAEEYAREFSIVLERCDDGNGFASNDAAADDTVTSAKEDVAGNPCVRLEPTFVGCTDANLLFGASNPFDGTVVKTTVAFDYDLYLPSDAVVEEAVAQLEETMLRHVAGGMNFDRCGASDDDGDADENDNNGNGRLLPEVGSKDDEEDKTEEIGFVGLSSRPVDVEDATYQQCTSNLSFGGGDASDESDTKCVPMKGRMTLYLSSKEDRFVAKHLIKTMVKSGAEDGAFVGAGNADEDGILGVAYVENRALDSAQLPGNNLEQFKASAGMSGLAIGLVSFLGVFVSCFAFGLVGSRRHTKQNSERGDSLDEEADEADLVKGEDGSFPTFPQLAKITPSDAESEVDLENPEVPIPTMTNTTSSELFSVDLGCNADDSTVLVANTCEDEGIHCVPLPPPASVTDLSEDRHNDSIPEIETSGSMDFGKSEEDRTEEDSLPCISTAGSMDFGTEMFSPIKFPAPNAHSKTGDQKVDAPEGPKVSEKRRLKTEVLLGRSPPFYGA